MRIWMSCRVKIKISMDQSKLIIPVKTEIGRSSKTLTRQADFGESFGKRKVLETNLQAGLRKLRPPSTGMYHPLRMKIGSWRQSRL